MTVHVIRAESLPLCMDDKVGHTISSYVPACCTHLHIFIFIYQISLHVCMYTYLHIYQIYLHGRQGRAHDWVPAARFCRGQGVLLVLFNIKCLIAFLYKVDGHGQMQTEVLPHVSRWDHSWLIILLVEVFPWSNRNNLKLQPRMEWDFGRHQSRKWKQGGRKYWTKKFLPKTLLVQVAFFVKHEVVGGQVEVLARTTFQIPDLVAACRWVNMSWWMKNAFLGPLNIL